MNKLQKILGIAALSLPLIVSGCKYEFIVKETSPPKKEEAIVEKKEYTPQESGLPMGIAIGQGDMNKSIALSQIFRRPEEYDIRFRTKSHLFKSDNEKIYKRFNKQGEKARVLYRDSYSNLYEREGDWWEGLFSCAVFDSKTKFKHRIKEKSEFIDAQPVLEQKK